MSVEGNTAEGSWKKKNLAPVWLEGLSYPARIRIVFSFEVMDHDNFGAADFMAACVEIKFALQRSLCRDARPLSLSRVGTRRVDGVEEQTTTHAIDAKPDSTQVSTRIVREARHFEG